MFKFVRIILLCLSVSFFSVCLYAFDAPKAAVAPVINGLEDDLAWHHAQWHPIDQTILGSVPNLADFSGRFKVVWTEQRLFVLAEIVDDVLIDQYSHPLDNYWNDDTFEVLIDEDRSGGDHLNSYNAFAYHIALDNQAVDINTSGKPRLLNDHVKSVWKRSATGEHITWEVSIDIYPDTFKDTYSEGDSDVSPVMLHAGKTMGIMIAYCDNDGAEQRDNFMTSYDIEAVNGDKNRAYFDADVFQSIVLIDK